MLNLLNILSVFPFAAILIPVGYLCVLALASIPRRSTKPSDVAGTRFAIAIPAHNEDPVIGATVQRLLRQAYPRNLFDVFVVADHCTDRTAAAARSAGAACLERNEGPRGGKGAALMWLFQHILERDTSYDAVVIFDADTQVDTRFLRVMDARLKRGDRAIQGCHRIINPQDGWFAALTWAMFIVDNRFQNLGRSNLGWSAKHMGDSVCFRADVLKRFGWGAGLTEDYEFRQKLLLAGIRIRYEPAAIGYGEAPASWTAARAQRARWLSGTFSASRRYGWEMLRQGLVRRDAALLDGAIQARFPSYSTLTFLSILILLGHLVLFAFVSRIAILAWLSVVVLLAFYPLIGLALERAPLRAYVAIMLGPVFIVWRTVLSISARLVKPTTWVRTAHRNSMQAGTGK